jgi:hypothetical protein
MFFPLAKCVAQYISSLQRNILCDLSLHSDSLLRNVSRH